MRSRAPGALSTSRPLKSRAVAEHSVARCRLDRRAIYISVLQCHLISESEDLHEKRSLPALHLLSSAPVAGKTIAGYLTLRRAGRCEMWAGKKHATLLDRGRKMAGLLTGFDWYCM
jgi:hypothetical protein